MQAKFTEKKYVVTLIFATSLFMLWGVAITMGDVLNKHFQNVLQVSKANSGLVQLSLFGAYAVMGIPAGLVMKKFGYKNGVLFGLALYAIGAFLFIPAANSFSFTAFRLALFVLACGLATLEAVAHPFVAALGDQRTSDRRINLAHAFNGIGAVSGPQIGRHFFFTAAVGSVAVAASLDSVKTLYIIIGCVVTLVGLAFSFVKVPALNDPHDATPENTEAALNIDTEPGKTLFEHKHFVWAVVAQLFNVAAQGGTWAFFINYGHDVMGLTDATAANYFSLSMLMMMIGRFSGTYFMKFVAPHKLLAMYAGANILMCLIVAQAWGWPSFIALLFINFFFSIMFPTIFSLGLKNLGKHSQLASSYITMGVVGGALMPYIMGKVANQNVAHAYYLPIVCYLVVCLFGARLYKVEHNRKPAVVKSVR
ncbi:MAG: L-fucose:H+ symporter permease [Sphingobacteriaceae bacterium]|nr:MAG: L-fucose:H+ symporter permease [Sphingobacteriaceae bacterium]